jgi:hypothetical protein
MNGDSLAGFLETGGQAIILVLLLLALISILRGAIRAVKDTNGW